MEWFKHFTKSHEDPDISDAWDEFGDAGPLIFWTILEVYGQEFSHLDNEDNLTLSMRYWERKLRRKYKSFEKVLVFFQERHRFYFSKNETQLSIRIPKFIVISSNWTRRKDVTPTEAPTEVTTEAPTAKEVEVEKKKEIYKESAQEVLKYLNWKTGRRWERIEEIMARLKDHSKEDCIKLIDNKLQDPFFQKNIDLYHPSTLFKKGHWDKYFKYEPPKTYS